MFKNFFQLGAVLFIVLFSMTSVKGDIKSDVEVIKQTIEEAYVKGVHKESNTIAMQKGFHPDFNMLINKNNKLSKRSLVQWAEKIKNKKKSNKKISVNHKFSFVNVTGDAAVAGIELFKNEALIYTDYMFLYKFSDGWKIVNKIFYHHLDSPTKSIKNETAPLRMLLVTGATPIMKWLKHNRAMVSTNLYTIFEEHDDIVWIHATIDEAAFENDIRKDFDVVVFFNRCDTMSQNAKNNLKDFVDSGKGIVLLHSALSSYNNWEWWWRDVVGGKYQVSENEKTPSSHSSHGQAQKKSFTIASNHPITKAVGAFTLGVETYSRLVISPKIQALYKSEQSYDDNPLIWIGPHRKSRVIVIQPGHFANSYLNPNFRTLIYQSILWAGRR